MSSNSKDVFVLKDEDYDVVFPPVVADTNGFSSGRNKVYGWGPKKNVTVTEPLWKQRQRLFDPEKRAMLAKRQAEVVASRADVEEGLKEENKVKGSPSSK